MVAIGAFGIAWILGYRAGEAQMCQDLCFIRSATKQYLVTDKYRCQCAPEHKWGPP